MIPGRASRCHPHFWQDRFISARPGFGFSLLIWVIVGVICNSEAAAYSIGPTDLRITLVTNVAQFKRLTATDYAVGCDFRLTGVVSLVDTNRELIVLQDASGAVALRTPIEFDLQPGELVTLEGSNCSPAFARFPQFPHRPNLSEIRQTFEAPINSGEYYLTRMRGWLRPPVSGNYNFWIASDNSSELWLGAEFDPSTAKLIASMPRYGWVASREWSKFPSQKSEAIWLEGGKDYYIEALQEQSHGDANLAVAWQGPGMNRAVIPAAHLTPWTRGRVTPNLSQNHGILLEHWTNYTAGSLSGLGKPRPFQSALSVQYVRVTERRGSLWPKARAMPPDAKSLAANNYCWVEAEGVVTFAGETGGYATISLADGKYQAQVRCVQGQSLLPRLTRNTTIRLEGVSEAFVDENGGHIPGVIWITDASHVSMIERTSSSPSMSSGELASKRQSNRAQALEGFYGTRGVVTFNDRVFGTDCLFVQEGNAVAFVKISKLQNQLKVGDWVDLGGSLEPGKFFPTIKPMVVVPLGSQPLPLPSTDPFELPIPNNRDGRWTEVEGVGRSVSTNGTLWLKTTKLPVPIWIGGTEYNQLNHYVDARIRVRGVLTAQILDKPVLLVPSRNFVELIKPAPTDPFAIPLQSVSEVQKSGHGHVSVHRVRLAGEVTLKDAASFFVQDGSGGICILPSGKSEIKVGDAVEVAGFPASQGGSCFLADALVRGGTKITPPKATKLDLTEALPIHQNSSLVRIAATLLAVRTVERSRVLELQSGPRVFTAMLSTNAGPLPEFAAGTRLEITGVCDTDGGNRLKVSSQEKAALASINLWLRGPSDIRLLSGPPWWNWQRASVLIGTLLAILTGAFLWIHLLRRRMERQRGAQLEASQQILKRLEEERRRIAANLHDSLGQVLIAIKNQTLILLQRHSTDTIVLERLGEISDATSQAIEEVRQITHGLRPYQLDRLGLTQAMRATVSRASANSAISFASRVEDIDDAFDKDSEIHVYRIVQEGINNILKHSDATEAAVVIKKRTNNVLLSIRDNGRGFDPEAMQTSQSNDLGYGLSGIAERVRILKGKFTINSLPGDGAILNLEIPNSRNGKGNHNPDC